MAPKMINDIFKLKTTPYKLWNHNSFVRRPVYLVFNGTETLSYLGPKNCDLVQSEI